MMNGMSQSIDEIDFRGANYSPWNLPQKQQAQFHTTGGPISDWLGSCVCPSQVCSTPAGTCADSDTTCSAGSCTGPIHW